MKVTLRLAQPEDEAFLLSVYASTRAEELARAPWNDEQRAQFLQMQCAAQSLHYRTHHPGATQSIILLDERPIGRLYLDRSDAAKLHILDVTLLTLERGHGVGTPLLLQLQSEAAATGRCLSIYLEQDNRSLTLFTRLGFVPVKEEGYHVRYEWRAGTTVSEPVASK